MTLLRLKHFFSVLLLSIKKKKIQFEYGDISVDMKTILQKMQDHHFIGGYKLDLDQNKVVIFLLYDKEAICALTNVKVISNISRRQMISLDKIKLFIKNYPSTLAFARTLKGILSFQECCTFGYGGEFLVILI